MAGALLDNDGDGKSAWYPSFEGEKPPKGQNPESMEPASEDVKKETTGTDQAPIYFTSTSGNPSASLSDKREVTAEINDAFTTQFGDKVPDELVVAYYNELRALQASRTTKPVTKGGIDYVTQGVSPQERKDILNKYLKQYATKKIADATLGDPKAVASLQRGNFGLTVTTLKNAYADNGVAYDFKTLAGLALESSLNPDRLKANINLINIQAKTLFPAISDKIDAGYTVKQILSPYISARANILEEDVDTIELKNFTDVAKDPKQLMGLYDYEISLRKDPKWRFTKNAEASLGGLARDITKMFGVTA